MLEKNALEWLDMGEGLEKLDIYKNNKISYIYTFFKILLKENDFPLYFYILLQIVFYLQLLCIIFLENDNNNYSKDYLIYMIFYISKVFLPQLIINNSDSFKIIMIIITFLLFILLSGFFVIFLGMKNDKKKKLL